MSKAQQIAIAALEMEVAVLKLQIALHGLGNGDLVHEYLEQALYISKSINKTFSEPSRR